MKNRILSMIVAWALASSAFAMSVETDHTWYLAGESMKVNVKAENTLIAYAELCDTQGMAAGVVVSLKGGEGTGVIELPSDLHSGYYVLSVYTRHNAEVDQQLVAVVNPLRKSTNDDIEWVKLADSESDSFATSELTPNDTFLLPPVTIPVDEREIEGHIIKARVKNTVYSASQICASVSIVGKQIHYFEGKMVNDSMAVFYTYGINGKQPLVLSAVTTTGVNLPIEVVSPFATLTPKELPHLVFHYKRSEVEARSLDMQRHQNQMEMAAAPAVTPDYDETVFGTKPDLSYNLDEYRQFRTIREVLVEYVSCVSSRKIDGVQKLIVRKEQDRYVTFLPTLVLIDGMPVSNVERLLNYDARRIHYINVYGGQYTFGNVVYNGILTFVTRSGQLTNYPTEPNMQYLVYEFPQ